MLLSRWQLDFFHDVAGELLLVVGDQVVDGVEVVEGCVQPDHKEGCADHPEDGGSCGNKSLFKKSGFRSGVNPTKLFLIR